MRASKARGAEETVLDSVAHDDTLWTDSNQSAGGATLQDPSRVTSELLTRSMSSGEALLHAERLRITRVAPLMVGMAIIAAATLPLFGGNPRAKLVLYATMAVGALGMTSLWWRAVRRKPVQGYQVAVAWSGAFAATCANTIYFGIYSPAPVLMTLAVLVYAQGHSRNLAVGAYLMAALTQGTIAALDALGIMTDPGILQASHLSAIERVAGQALVQTLLVAAFILGRSARQAATRAIEQVQQAARELQRREVLALEAKDQVQRVFNIGGAGRLSGQHVGRYTLSEVLGQGGMGEVYRAKHQNSEQEAAIKVMHAHLCQDATVVQRFLREAQLAASLESNFVVRILDAGQFAEGPYLVMELLRGRDLSDHMREKGPLALAELEVLAAEVGKGLDSAHEAGIVHRDIKPQNLFVVAATEAKAATLHFKILDFGIARAISGHETLTQGGAIFGTPAYMAPEQATGLVADHRTDLYALIAVLYRAGTGFPPVTGDSTPALLYKVVHETPMPPSECGLPKSLDAFFARGFAKDPESRFQSGAELSQALADAIHES